MGGCVAGRTMEMELLLFFPPLLLFFIPFIFQLICFWRRIIREGHRYGAQRGVLFKARTVDSNHLMIAGARCYVLCACFFLSIPILLTSIESFGQFVSSEFVRQCGFRH